MTFGQYWSIVVQRWYLILACCVLVGIGATLVSLFITPVYRSAVLIQVAIHSSGNQSDINDLLASNQLVQTEAQLATSDPIVKEVAIHHPGLTSVQLANMVSSSVKLNTQLFEIDVQDTDAQRAATLANEVAQTFIQHQERSRQQEDKEAQKPLQQEITTTQHQIDALKILPTPSPSPDTSAKGATDSSPTEQITPLQQHYNQWQLALAQLELSQAQRSNFLLIVQPAQVNPEPVQPKFWLNVGGGLVAGLVLGLIFVLIWDQIDQRIYTSEMLQQLVDWPILALISRVPTGERIIHPQGMDTNVEAYRILRSNIGFAGVDKPLRSLMVTSALSREGKSTVAANLAIYMALAGKRTLLIDADLLCPTLHEKFSIAAGKPGLSNAILACGMPRFPTPFPRTTGVINPRSISIAPFIHQVDIPNLSVMPSGPLPPNPSELFDSQAMQRFFQALDTYGVETIIFDTSPLLGLSEAMMLSAKVDGTIVVADLSCIHKPDLRQAQSLLVQAGAHLVGCVLNQQPPPTHRSAHSLYRNYRWRSQIEKNDAKPSLFIQPQTMAFNPETASGSAVGQKYK
ncbi:hypothetical protein KDW_00190 [Dictyobacter vulcani]|uniref:CobQ/CobB/MinD/ParA nucleotide binding domain-containing protein n=1 Tax=Dictyobacter vulcani TaxID=2607529 RepID=A0A5J4KHG1_9CHLR|nr:Wzz/FepE/Etk N-terminal domain-containing protein [Dictyobacter vulcani]GER85857.1 hypothetical protein KDW_00190 [Dictyobacter vulcani]